MAHILQECRYDKRQQLTQKHNVLVRLSKLTWSIIIFSRRYQRSRYCYTVASVVVVVCLSSSVTLCIVP